MWFGKIGLGKVECGLVRRYNIMWARYNNVGLYNLSYS